MPSKSIQRGPEGQLGQLAYAIVHGRHDVIESLIAEGADVNAAPVPGSSFMHSPSIVSAAAYCDVRICELLIKAGADLRARNELERTALHVAALEGHPDVCRRLLAAGAEVDARDKNGETPLFLAVCKECEEVFDLLLESGADPHALSAFETTPLHFAARHRQVNMGQALIDLGVDVSVAARTHAPYGDARWYPSQFGNVTALHVAVESDSVELCRMLVARGADPMVMPSREFDRDYRSPLQSAIEKLANADMAPISRTLQ
jgi:ankyrin repeat protein